MAFDDYWNDRCDSSEDLGVEDVSGQVEQSIKIQEKIEPGDLQEEASVDVTRPENQAEGAALRQHHNAAVEDVEDKKVKRSWTPSSFWTRWWLLSVEKICSF